jgi:hypothetical protein
LSRGIRSMATAHELGILFLIAFFAMLIAEALSMFPLPRYDEYCSEDALKLICLEYMYMGLVNSCD